MIEIIINYALIIESKESNQSRTITLDFCTYQHNQLKINDMINNNNKKEVNTYIKFCISKFLNP